MNADPKEPGFRPCRPPAVWAGAPGGAANDSEPFLYLMALLEVSGSWAETFPMEVPTRESSETTMLASGAEKTGGSSTSCTVTLTEVVSLKGPRLRKLVSMFLLVASIRREKLLFASKSSGWRRHRDTNGAGALRLISISRALAGWEQTHLAPASQMITCFCSLERSHPPTATHSC